MTPIERHSMQEANAIYFERPIIISVKPRHKRPGQNQWLWDQMQTEIGFHAVSQLLARTQAQAKLSSNDWASAVALGPLVLCSSWRYKSKGKHYCKLNALLPPFMPNQKI